MNKKLIALAVRRCNVCPGCHGAIGQSRDALWSRLGHGQQLKSRWRRNASVIPYHGR